MRKRTLPPACRGTRTGLINIWWVLFLGSVVLFGLLVAMLAWDPSQWFRSSEKQQPLVIYCAAAVQAPVEAVAKEYEETFGVPIQLQFGNSQTLLTNVAVSRRGDLFLPADDSYLDLARGKDLIDETIPLARMTAVLAVRKGNPKKITKLDDVLRQDVILGQANPDATAVGKLTRDALVKVGRWKEIHAHTRVDLTMVNEMANAIKLGSVDAGFVWDATVDQYPELEAVALPELALAQASMSIAVLRSTVQPTAALHFARYLAARDRGLQYLRRAGFRVVDGDQWADQPELHLLAGAMLRPAVEETITAFEQREGVRVIRVYNGCGILVAQMQAGERPDAYFACDQQFMDQVRELFNDAVTISSNQLVILVPKGNPHGIRSLQDLGKPGLRIGVGHEKQCALGVITQETLKRSGFHSAVSKNIKVQTPTGDMLVNQMRTGSLDVIIAYLSNATAAADELEAISIDIPCAIATQPFAIGKQSAYRQLTARLLEAIRSRESRERFESSGFRWGPPKN